MISALARFANALVLRKPPADLRPPSDRGRWWNRVSEPFSGAWQRNLEQSRETVVTFGAVYACVSLIASDVGKIRIKLVEQDGDGIWSEATVPAFSPVLRKPNKWQNRINFIEQWVVSKLLHGNTYVLKQRDARGVVVGLYILDPNRVKVLVAPNGDVYYEIRKDNLANVDADTITVPASEIIHDIMVALYHPLCGVSPLTACGAAAAHGLTIQRNSARLFENNSQPGGLLIAPGAIDAQAAQRLKELWETNYSGANAGRVAVLGDNLKYERMSLSATDTQLMAQLEWDEKNVCTAFHVPPYMIGVGQMPSYDNIDALNQQYYSQCLQKLIECIELCLDEGLGLTAHKEHVYGTEFDLDDLLRMDTSTKVKAAVEGLKGLFTPNEARKKFDLPAITGGDTVYMQQQNYSLEALAKRDALPDPFSRSQPTLPADKGPPPMHRQLGYVSKDMRSIGEAAPGPDISALSDRIASLEKSSEVALFNASRTNEILSDRIAAVQTIDDISMEYDGERTITWKIQRGEHSKEFVMQMPIVIDRGIYDGRKIYEPGDGVTWTGSFFIAQRRTSSKPLTLEAKDDWRLAVKRGSAGKDARLPHNMKT